MRISFIFLMLMTLNISALAVEPDEMLKDKVLEGRAREISRELRCLVCQGEAIDDSRADFAKDMRLLVRERLKAGATDEEVLRYMHERYGDFILLNPPVEKITMLLWLTPAIIFAAGLAAAMMFMRKHRKP